jgi:hypothetical protein
LRADAGRRHERGDERLQGQLVGLGRPLRKAGDGGELLVVAPVVEREDVVDGARLERDLVDIVFVCDQHFVEPRRERLDRLDHRTDLRVLGLGDLCRNENAEMADAVMERVDDDVPVCREFGHRGIEVGDPAQGLLRRRDVVAMGCEDDDRRLDPGQIDRRAVVEERLAAGELVADEQVLDDPADLGGVHEIESRPPALEIEKARRLAVDLGEQIEILAEPGLAGIELLEIEHQVGAVEPAAAEIGCEHRRQRSAGDAAEVAQGIAASRARPIGERRSGDHHRPHQVGMGRGENRGGPATLAISGDQRLRTVGVAGVNLLQEHGLRRGHVGDGLARLRVRKEDHEINGMAVFQRHADFGFALEAADPAAVAGTRIDDHPRPRALVGGRRSLRRMDAHQGVIDRAIELAAVDDKVVVEGEDRLEAVLVARDAGIAALAQRFDEKHRALRKILGVVRPFVRELRREQQRHQVLPRGQRRLHHFRLAAADRLAMLQSEAEEQRCLRPRLRPILAEQADGVVANLRGAAGVDRLLSPPHANLGR